MIRIAAVGDLHIGLDSVGTFEHHLDRLASHADALLLAVDLTRVGDPAEAVLAGALADLGFLRSPCSGTTTTTATRRTR